MLKPLALIAALFATPASAATLSYVVNVGGVYVATASAELTEDAGSYSIDLKANVAGLGTLIANGNIAIKSSGQVNGKSFASETYDLLTRAGGGAFKVEIGFAGGNVDRFVVTPSVLDTPDRIAIERKHLRGVNDLIASFILRGSKLDGALCNRTVKVFSGVERFDIEMRYIADDVATSKRTGYNGPVILCGLKYLPVSGHYTTDDMGDYLAASDRIHLWYMPLGDGNRTFVPYRLLMPTAYGDLSMVLTKYTPD